MNAITEDAMVATQVARRTQPFPWLIRRELWENRALYLVPAIVCALLVLFVIIAMIRGNDSVRVDGREIEAGLRAMLEGNTVVQRAIVAASFGMLAAFVSIAMMIVGWFYTLDSLHSERRDRSILFWKSMPLSDAETVLSKLFTASLGIAAIAFVFVLATHVLMMVLTSIYLLLHGVSIGVPWGSMSLVEAPGAYIYILLVQVLWFAPVYCWLLLVSAWAKRMTFLWAILPPALLALSERVGLGTTYFLDMLGHRFAFFTQTHAFRFEPGMLAKGPEKMQFPKNLFDLMDPAGFLANPYLWIGLVLAAAMVVGAIWLRRYREPL